MRLVDVTLLRIRRMTRRGCVSVWVCAGVKQGDGASLGLMDSPEHTRIHTHPHGASLAITIRRCMQSTHASHDTHPHAHAAGNWVYHENLLTKMVLRIDTHGQREHLELISLLCFDKSFGADSRLTIQTLLIHKKHICLLPIPIVNNQQVR